MGNFEDSEGGTALSKLAYGYFDDPQQYVAAYDPGIDDVLCPICSEPLNREDLRTISMMEDAGPHASYFYRVHKSCHESLTQLEQDCIDCLIWDSIELESRKP